MSQSQDIIISDLDDAEMLQINDSKLNFDDLVQKSTAMIDSKNDKNEKNTNKLTKLNAKDLKINQMLENEQNEPERQRIIHIIQKYQASERFGSYIRTELKITYSNDTLNKKSITQLEGILEKIRLHLDNRNLNQVYDSVLFSTTQMIELMSKPVANVDGFTKMLRENEEFANCWEKFKCESVMPTIPSHLQMLFILGQTYLMAYSINKSNDISPETAQILTEIENEVDEEQSQNKQI